MRLLIEGGSLVDPASGLDGDLDLLIEDGRVAAVGPGLRGELADGVDVLDAAGCVVAPGLVDVHVHLREPGFEYKETIASGTRAAAAGGFTTVCCMANTDPVNDNGAVTEFIIKEAASRGACKVYPIGAVSKKLEGRELAEIGDMAEAGCVALSDDGRPVLDSGLMRRAMEYAGRFGLAIVGHCEDTGLTREAVMHEGPLSTELGLIGWPAPAEEILVARDIVLAEAFGRPVHLAHLSSAGSVRLLREAKARGVPVTAEVTPHHLTLTDEAVRGYDTSAKMNPPLRSAEDREALRGALAEGLIDAVATDHAPHAASDKEVEFDRAAFGVVGLETALALVLRLSEEGVLTLPAAVERLTSGPARCLGLSAGTLAVGSPADVVVFNPETAWTVEPERFYSRGRNTPFAGWEVKGKVMATLVDGRVVYTDGDGVLV
ncbi:dihydroorotase [Nitrospinae bacterium AH-259-F20]|nr:dihydroorotase [Nitrospinae bacterium AH-259-F20]